jgi:hypothetical protein
LERRFAIPGNAAWKLVEGIADITDASTRRDDCGAPTIPVSGGCLEDEFRSIT